MRWMTLSSLCRLDRLGNAALNRFFEAPNVDGQQHVRRAVGAFSLDALLKAFAGGDNVDLDAGVFRGKRSSNGWINFRPFTGEAECETWLMLGVRQREIR